jgi:hypothetical protein
MSTDNDHADYLCWLTWAAQVVGERVDEDAPESEPVGSSLQWSENRPPSEKRGYDHCMAETPFSRFLITCKSWKKINSPIGKHPPTTEAS